MSKKNPTPREEERKVQAVERNERWAALSAAEKLAELDRRLGTDLGAVKQRRKLEKAL